MLLHLPWLLLYFSSLLPHPDRACTPAKARFRLPATACPAESVLLNGKPSTGEEGYFIEIAETDRAGSTRQVTDHYGRWFAGEAGEVDLRVLYKPFVLKPGKTYLVKLGVYNCCTNWQEQVKWVTMLDEKAGPCKP